MEEKINLLDDDQLLPGIVRSILDSYDENADLFGEAERMVRELKDIGYSADFGLDGIITVITKD